MSKKIVRHNADIKFAKIKKESPGIPPDTCPYLDHINEVVKDLSTLVTENKSDIADHLCELIRGELDYVRAANETLRTSSKYWYDQHKIVFYKRSRRKN